MVRYFFHLRSVQGWFQDTEGTELASVEEAALEASRNARELVSRALLSDAPVRWDDAIEVHTADGVLFAVTCRQAVGF